MIRAASIVRTAPVVLLGAQRFEPTLGARVEALGIRGKLAIITAGWQERETDDADLIAHLDGRTVRLELHARGEQVFRDDPELATGHRARQDTLRAMQDFYRLRLQRALEAERAVREAPGPAAVREEARQACVQAIRDLDDWHLAQCARVRARFDALHHPNDRPAVRRQQAILARLLADCEGVCIAGGHVAVLINRMLMFDLQTLIGDRPVFAWSGGAMSVCDRIVLFHEQHGDGACEVLDRGLGLVPGVVAFPEPESRLKHDDAERLSLKINRFSPATCLTLPARSSVVYRSGRLSEADGVEVLGGSLDPSLAGQ